MNWVQYVLEGVGPYNPVQIGRCGLCFSPIFLGDAYNVVSTMVGNGNPEESMCCSVGCVPEEYTFRQVDPMEVSE